MSLNQHITRSPAVQPFYFLAAGAVPGSSATAGKSANNSDYSLQGNPGHAAVIGLGQSGLATALFLSRLGLDVDVYDSSQAPALREQLKQQLPDVGLHCGSLAVERWRDDSLLVVSPGVPLSHPELAPLLNRGIRPVGDVELFAQCVQAPVIAITGSNGKSTVTALLGEILQLAGKRTAVGGNIGVPVLDLLDENIDLYVLELSSFQLETTWSLQPAIATVLNIAADHMDRYRSLDDYIASKARVYRGSGRALLNTDDSYVMQMPHNDQQALFFGSAIPGNEQEYGLAVIDGRDFLCRGSTGLIGADEIPLAGQLNQLNVLAAWALASHMGLADSQIKQTVLNFRGLPHRMEVLFRADGVTWINDSKGTNVGASVAALQGLTAPVILIAGGIAKDADFMPLREAVNQHVKAALLIGRDAGKIEQALSAAVPVFRAADMAAAVARAHHLAEQGDIVLLSPACASFDMYDNFEQRGDDFRSCAGAVR